MDFVEDVNKNMTTTFKVGARIYSAFDVLSRLSQYSKVIYNWPGYLAVKLRLSKNVKFRFRDGSSLLFNGKNQDEFGIAVRMCNLRLNGFEVKQVSSPEKGYMLTGEGLKFFVKDLRDLIPLYEDILEGQYAPMKSEGRDVLDVGANFGDTAVYFAKVRKANRVIAFEPFSKPFEISKKNVKLNNIENNVILFQQAVSDVNSTITVPDSDTGGQLSSSVKKGKKVKTITLKDIVTKYKLKNAVLKMDCEGYEYPILLNTSNETLSHFDQMVIECHYGYLNIENHLKKAGFRVTHTLTAPGGWTKNTCRNIVYAFRK